MEDIPAPLDATVEFEALTEENTEAVRRGLKLWRQRLIDAGFTDKVELRHMMQEIDLVKPGFKLLSLKLGPPQSADQQLREAESLCRGLDLGLALHGLPLTEEEVEVTRIVFRNFAKWSIAHGCAMVARAHARQEAEKKKPPE